MTRIAKIQLELHLPGDGRTFLNFWDSSHGRDVCCEVINGRLILSDYDRVTGEDLPDEELTIQEFINKVVLDA